MLEDAGFFPRSPVCPDLHAGLAQMHYLAVRRPAPLPSEVPCGPQPEPMVFTRVHAQLDAAFIRAKRGGDG
eukprot:4298211-Pyramimonas_sp.AAC.1